MSDQSPPSSPTIYPRRMSYRPALKQLLAAAKGEKKKEEKVKPRGSTVVPTKNKDSVNPAPTKKVTKQAVSVASNITSFSDAPTEKPLKPGETRTVDVFDDNSTLSITRNVEKKEETFIFTDRNNRKVYLKKTADFYVLAQYDDRGKQVRTLGCEF